MSRIFRGLLQCTLNHRDQLHRLATLSRSILVVGLEGEGIYLTCKCSSHDSESGHSAATEGCQVVGGHGAVGVVDALGDEEGDAGEQGNGEHGHGLEGVPSSNLIRHGCPAQSATQVAT